MDPSWLFFFPHVFFSAPPWPPRVATPDSLTHSLTHPDDDGLDNAEHAREDGLQEERGVEQQPGEEEEQLPAPDAVEQEDVAQQDLVVHGEGGEDQEPDQRGRVWGGWVDCFFWRKIEHPACIDKLFLRTAGAIPAFLANLHTTQPISLGCI